VKFVTEFDALDIVTPELQEKLTPVSRRLKEIEKERFERRKVRKRTKAALSTAPAPPPTVPDSAMSVDEPTAASSGTPGELEEESVYRSRELTELEGLVDPSLKDDFGCSLTGLYDLVGMSNRILVIQSFFSLPSLMLDCSNRNTQGRSSRRWSLYGICKEWRVPWRQIHRRIHLFSLR